MDSSRSGSRRRPNLPRGRPRPPPRARGMAHSPTAGYLSLSSDTEFGDRHARGVDVLQLADRRADGRGVRGRPAGRRISAPGDDDQMGGPAAGRRARAAHRPGTLPHTTTWLDEYFAGSAQPFPYPDHLKRWFDLSPPRWPSSRPFAGSRSARPAPTTTSPARPGLHPRQIGWLVAANHLAILIPCHRVVGKDGSLVGYGGGLARKRWLLDHELRAAGVVLR